MIRLCGAQVKNLKDKLLNVDLEGSKYQVFGLCVCADIKKKEIFSTKNYLQI